MNKNYYKTGDRVSVLDEAINGIVSFTKLEFVTIVTNDGVTMEFHESELIHDIDLRIGNVKIKDVENVSKNKKRHQSRKKAKIIPAIEVDLHIHHLVKSERGMNPNDKLNKQLDTAKFKLDWAIKNRIPKLIFIHGVGSGVLRAKLEYLLDKYEKVVYYDADYKKYGRGATEVSIKQNTN